jgi:hypothetical protein
MGLNDWTDVGQSSALKLGLKRKISLNFDDIQHFCVKNFVLDEIPMFYSKVCHYGQK